MYSLRTSPDGYRITKFDREGNVEATYLTSRDACECPAGTRPTCRHRQMLPQLEPIADTHWFLIWEPQGNILHGSIVDFNGTPKHLIDRLTLSEGPESASDQSEPELIRAYDPTIPVVDPRQRGATPEPAFAPFVRRL